MSDQVRHEMIPLSSDVACVCGMRFSGRTTYAAHLPTRSGQYVTDLREWLPEEDPRVQIAEQFAHVVASVPRPLRRIAEWWVYRDTPNLK